MACVKCGSESYFKDTLLCGDCEDTYNEGIARLKETRDEMVRLIDEAFDEGVAAWKAHFKGGRFHKAPHDLGR